MDSGGYFKNISCDCRSDWSVTIWAMKILKFNRERPQKLTSPVKDDETYDFQ